MNAKKPLIYRTYGGLGDILHLRLLFESVFNHYGSCSIAVPSKYHPVLLNHPFLNNLMDCKDVNLSEFEVFNIDDKDRWIEQATKGRFNRLETWSKLLKVKLIQNPQSYLSSAVKPSLFGSNYAVVAPISAYSEKNLLPGQILPVCEALERLGLRVIGLHDSAMPWMEEAGYWLPRDLSLSDWLSCIAGASLVVTAESAAVHGAGQLGVPFVAVCGSGNGSTICKYYRNCEVVQSSAECSPCGFPLGCPFAGLVKPCISSISAEEILAAVERSRNEKTLNRMN
jgi:ADP-heptose:LPS heptosyltransferase